MLRKKSLSESSPVKGSLTEAIDPKKLEALNTRIKALLDAVKPYQGDMPETSKALNKAAQDVVKAMGGGIGTQGMQTLKGAFGADVESQVMNLYTMFYNLKTNWPSLKTALENSKAADEGTTAAGDGESGNVDQLKEKKRQEYLALVTKAISPGLIKGTKAFAFLDPQTFSNEVITSIDQNGFDKIEGFLNGLNLESPATVDPDPENNGQGGVKPSTDPQTTQGSKGSNPPTPAGQAGTTDSSQQAGAQAPANYDSNTVTDIANKTNSKPEQINTVLSGLDGAGYKVVRK